MVAMATPRPLVRRPNLADLYNLHALISNSTNGKSKITTDRLREDLFGLDTTGLESPNTEDPVIELDVNRIRSNRPACQSFVSEVDGVLVAYVIYHYFYSPWTGHCYFVDDVYTTSNYRRKGIATDLLRHVSMQAKDEKVSVLLFNSKDFKDQQLLEMINEKYKPQVLRDDKTDWSVFRVDFPRDS